jgi:hypothetical protein
MQINSISTNTSSTEQQPSWTKQQIDQLKTLLDQNLPLDQIALRLKRSPVGIKFEAAALGLKLKTK